MDIVRVALLLSFWFWATCAIDVHDVIFNVKHYGAVPDGKTDNSEAFLRAWKDACGWGGRAKILIPQGEYMVDSLQFIGPCKGLMVFFLRGILKPPIYTSSSEYWITFRYVYGLRVAGGGTLDGEGHKVWGVNNCDENHNCRPLPTSMRFEFVNNAKVHHIQSINSRNAHFSLFACTNFDIHSLKISAPGNSPNTDGIKIGNSNRIKISHTRIGTGDDCIAIISGSRDVDISEVYCGPGHGISVGSMGKYANNNEVVTGVMVRNCSFYGTSYGVRIKTWASNAVGMASNFTYQNVRMNNVQNPIIIDQHYCPYRSCDQQIPSHIQIRDITYDNIWGTSSSKYAVSLQCSEGFPCRNIVLKDINLSQAVGGVTTALCSNVLGNSYGQQRPPSCL